jgi:hypothetical protein
LLVEFDDGGLGIRSQLSGSGTQSIGRLQGMAPLNAAPALPTPPDVDVELPVDGPPRDLDLVLLSEVAFVEGSAAVGAGVWQSRLVGFIDPVGGRRLAVSLGAVGLAGLTAGPLGLVLGLALREGPGLALTGAGRLVELAAEALVLGLQMVEAPLKGLAAGTGEGLHTFIIRKAWSAAALPRPQIRDQLELEALNKHASRCKEFALYPGRTHNTCSGRCRHSTFGTAARHRSRGNDHHQQGLIRSQM